MGNPPVLILDEPMVGLDPSQIIEMRELIRSLTGEHTVILSSHILSEIETVCDHIIILDHGAVTAENEVKKLEEEKKAAEDAANEPDEKLPGEDTPAVDPNETKEPDTSVSDSKRKVGWLDLTGHSEVTVLPEKVFNEYASYYTTAGVNLRSGPSTSYGKAQLVDRGTKVKAAAKEGNWTFVSVGSKFGWISSDYLSTKPPVEVTSGSLSRT